MIALLIRHGHTDAVGNWLAGRQPEVPLSRTGTQQAAALAVALRWLPLAAVYSSPLERALRTAEPLSRDRGLPVRTSDAFTDIDFGAWTGRTLSDLQDDPAWQAFNRNRQNACAPGGEALTAVQQRVVDELIALSRRHRGEMIAIVTHAEPIRCAIAEIERISLDAAMHLEIEPACISTLGLDGQLRRVLAINMRPELAAA